MSLLCYKLRSARYTTVQSRGRRLRPASGHGRPECVARLQVLQIASLDCFVTAAADQLGAIRAECYSEHPVRAAEQNTQQHVQ